MTGTMQQLLNILIPGAGLIVRCREWLGFSLALIFAICGNIAVAGWLIAPEAFPGWFTWLATALTVFAWCLAQVLFWKQGAALVRLRAERENTDAPSETAGVLRA